MPSSHMLGLDNRSRNCMHCMVSRGVHGVGVTKFIFSVPLFFEIVKTYVSCCISRVYLTRFARLKCLLTEKLANGALVTPTSVQRKYRRCYTSNKILVDCNAGSDHILWTAAAHFRTGSSTAFQAYTHSQTIRKVNFDLACATCTWNSILTYSFTTWIERC